MKTPKELSGLIGATPQDIRKLARQLYGRPQGGWKFTEEQVLELKRQLQGTASQSATVAVPQVGRSRITSLQQFANGWLRENYQLTLDVPLEINGRLSRALGRFVYNRHEQRPKKVELSKRLLQYYPEETILDVLKHELVHYACYVKGEPHDDGHPHFEGELRKHGVTGTGIIKAKGLFHKYSCNSCGGTFTRRNRISPQRMSRSITNCCNSKFSYIGQIEKD